MPSASAYRFFVQLDGLALSTEGFVFGWNGATLQAYTEYITPMGLLTDGFVVGMADFWQYGDDPANANWTYGDL